ncbi:MAG: sigma-70 family RNA polymerase sigma factor, partial [Thermodesulfobacteriota bacterium]
LSDDLEAQELNEKLELEAVIERIEGIVEILTPTEQKVIELEFSNELTQKDIALKLGISQQAVSKHRLKGLEKLRSAAKLPSD